jgi:hypothetical protein
MKLGLYLAMALLLAIVLPALGDDRVVAESLATRSLEILAKQSDDHGSFERFASEYLTHAQSKTIACDTIAIDVRMGRRTPSAHLLIKIVQAAYPWPKDSPHR